MKVPEFVEVSDKDDGSKIIINTASIRSVNEFGGSIYIHNMYSSSFIIVKESYKEIKKLLRMES